MLAICYREVGDEPLRQFEEEVIFHCINLVVSLRYPFETMHET
jgi:hypothetical protein